MIIAHQVLGRLTRSVVPFSVNFLATVKDNPDMYMHLLPLLLSFLRC